MSSSFVQASLAAGVIDVTLIPEETFELEVITSVTMSCKGAKRSFSHAYVLNCLCAPNHRARALHSL